LTRPARIALTPPLYIDVTYKAWLVDTRIGIGCEGICDEISLTGVYYEDGRIGPHEEVDVCAIGPKRSFGSDDHGQDYSRLFFPQHVSFEPIDEAISG
jgi:hypothetical protein